MPYLKNEDKPSPCQFAVPQTPAHLNYYFSLLADSYLYDKGKKYQHYNDIIGALESAKLEFYRRMVSSYEDQKLFENGDVYT